MTIRQVNKQAKFKTDYKKLKHRVKDCEIINQVIHKLTLGEELDARFKKHQLIGKYKGCWECHIGFDLLLIWEEDADSVMLLRVGNHTNLFD